MIAACSTFYIDDHRCNLEKVALQLDCFRRLLSLAEQEAAMKTVGKPRNRLVNHAELSYSLRNYTKLPFLGYTVVYHIFGRTQLFRTDGFRCTARYVLSVSIQQALIEILEDCDTRTTATGAYQSKGIKTVDIKSSRATRHNIFALVQHRTSGQLFAFAGESPARFRSGPKALSEPGRDGRDVQRQHL